MVFIGSSACGYANHPKMPELIEHAKLVLQRQAHERGMAFVTTGVSIDQATENGLRHLAQFGLFDEIMTGRNWQGIGARQYMWEALPGSAATPQVLVATRTVGEPVFHVSDERVVLRKVGFTQINDWLDRGAPLPADL